VDISGGLWTGFRGAVVLRGRAGPRNPALRITIVAYDSTGTEIGRYAPGPG
jgi:hypothetical protein